MDLTNAQDLYTRADYYQAYVSIVRARDAKPDDPEIERLYWKIRQAYLLHEAQRLVFSGREEEAIENLEKVLALDPENVIALRWKQKALTKLGDRSAADGDRLIAAGDLQGALQAFQRALGFDPSNELAKDGLAKLDATWKTLQGQARSHFVDGVRAFGEHEYRRTKYHMGIALDKDPALVEARDPASVAARQIAEERFASARKMEADGYFAPALREYEEIAKLDVEVDGLAERIERITAEVEAQQLSEQGEYAIHRNDFAKARELLSKAFEVSTQQREAIGNLLLMAQERELDATYLEGKDLELQNRLDAALTVYGDVEKKMPGFRDVRARISDLELRIAEAQKAYAAGAEAEQKGELDAAIDSFTDVQLFWQGYLDSRPRLEALRKQRAAARTQG